MSWGSGGPLHSSLPTAQAPTPHGAPRVHSTPGRGTPQPRGAGEPPGPCPPLPPRPGLMLAQAWPDPACPKGVPWTWHHPCVPQDSLAEDDSILQPLLEIRPDLLPGDALDPRPQLCLLLRVILLGELAGRQGLLRHIPARPCVHPKPQQGQLPSTNPEPSPGRGDSGSTRPVPSRHSGAAAPRRGLDGPGIFDQLQFPGAQETQIQQHRNR